MARVDTSELTELIITDSIGNHEVIAHSAKVRHLTIAPLLAEAIKRIAEEASVSSPVRLEQRLADQCDPHQDHQPVDGGI